MLPLTNTLTLFLRAICPLRAMRPWPVRCLVAPRQVMHSTPHTTLIHHVCAGWSCRCNTHAHTHTHTQREREAWPSRSTHKCHKATHVCVCVCVCAVIPSLPGGYNRHTRPLGPGHHQPTHTHTQIPRHTHTHIRMPGVPARQMITYLCQCNQCTCLCNGCL